MSGKHRRPHCSDEDLVKLIQTRVASMGGQASEREITVFVGLYIKALRDVLESGRTVHLRGGAEGDKTCLGMLSLDPCAERAWSVKNGFGKPSQGVTPPRYKLSLNVSPEFKAWAQSLAERGGK